MGNSSRDTVERAVRQRLEGWRPGDPGSQRRVTSALVILTAVMLVVSLLQYSVLPVSGFLIPVIVAGLLLTVRPFVVVAAVALVAGTISAVATVISSGFDGARFSAWMILNIVAGLFFLFVSHSRTGLPAPLGDAMLVDLRDRLNSHGEIPDLPRGWRVESMVASAGGAQFAGDFTVAHLSSDRRFLEFVLVDVCGKGVAAGGRALQFSGALGGLIGAVPPRQLMEAANEYLLRQDWLDGFATAVHVWTDLRTGDYTVLNAGHPPALHWVSAQRDWLTDDAHGMALGIDPSPTFAATAGRIQRGDAIMLVTDGVVESHEHDVIEGVAWLKPVAAAAISQGFEHAPARIISQVDGGDDDRAVVIIHRR